MPIIVGFVSQKGGVGKSTLARALAVAAAKAGWKVRIADLDFLQQTCVGWHFRRLNNKHEPVIEVRPHETVKDALASAQDVELLIIDGPARATFETIKIAAAADIIVQPSNGHVDDLEPAVKVFHELTREGVPKSMLRIALSRIGTPAEEQRARAYVTAAGYQVLDGSIAERAAYGQAQDMGQAVIETRFGTLNEQADKLIESLLAAIMSASESATAAPVAAAKAMAPKATAKVRAAV